MKRGNSFSAWFTTFLFIFVSCDPSGNVIITNGYLYGITVHIEAEYNGEKYAKLVNLESEINYAPAAMGHEEFNHITTFRLFTLEEEFIVEYSGEYIKKIRDAYKVRKNQAEIWIFTEKGLFFETRGINKKYKFDREKILEHYRSDEAVRDLEAALGRSESNVNKLR